MSEKKQSWETCKYSAKGRVACCSEYFSCLNEKTAESGIYSKLLLQKKDGSVVVSSTLFNHSYLNPGGIIDLQWPDDVALMSLIQDKLLICSSCESYEPRKGKQTKFGKLKKEKIENINFISRELKIINP